MQVPRTDEATAREVKSGVRFPAGSAGPLSAPQVRLNSQSTASTNPTNSVNSKSTTMSRLAYYPTPANRRLGNFTLDVCSIVVGGQCMSDPFADRKTMVR